MFNFEKSVLNPQEVITELGTTLDNKLTNTPYRTARKVTETIGKIISTIFVVGNIVRLKSRYLHINLFCRKHLGIRISVYFIIISVWKK